MHKNSRLRYFACSVAFAVLAGCGDGFDHARLEATASALAKASDECLIDVRDRKMKYDKSSVCNSLRPLYLKYMDAGGFRPQTPSQYALIAAQAQATAWNARAVSEAGNVPLTIW
jgi:hypothetical protein